MVVPSQIHRTRVARAAVHPSLCGGAVEPAADTSRVGDASMTVLMIQ
jgi:hypothetical protein